MRKKLLSICIAVLMGISVIKLNFNVINSDAAIKEENISNSILTNQGIINIGEWQMFGENQDTVFTTKSFGDVFIPTPAPDWGNGWFAPTGSVEGKQETTMEFDLIQMEASLGIAPFAFSTGYLDPQKPDSEWVYLHNKLEFRTAHNVVKKDNTEEQVGVYTGWKLDGGFRYQLIFKTNGTLVLSQAPINPDKSYGAMEKQFEVKEAFNLPEGTNYFFGFNFKGTGTFDNFIFKTEAKTICDIDFTSPWSSTDANVNTTDKTKVYVNSSYGTESTNISEVAFNNPANSNRMTTYTKVKLDKKLEKAFDLNCKINLKTLALSKKVGIGFGLSTEEQALDATGVSYIYFENITVDSVIKTQVNIMKNGVIGTPTILSEDLTTKGFFDVKIVGGTDKKITITIGTQNIEYLDQNIEGLVTIATSGEGDSTFMFKPDFSILTYTYREGNGADSENNFNTGYINGEKWIMQSMPALNLENPGLANGMVVEDGMLKFDGSGDGSHFAPVGDFADFILEFDYISTKIEDRPAVTNNPYSYLGIAIGKKEELGGWATSKLLEFFDYRVQEGFNQSSLVLENFDEGIAPAQMQVVRNEAGELQGNKIDFYNNKTKFKIVALKNKITVYAVALKDDGKPKGEYVVMGEFTCKDTFGKISFSTTDNAFFSLDNIRITKIDGHDTAPSDYEDFKVIADENRPIIAVDKVTLDKTSNELEVGGEFTLKATVSPINAENKALLWSSSDTSVATCENGKVVALKEGTAIITVKTVDGNFTATCTVNVKNKEAEKPIEKNGCACGTIGFNSFGGGMMIMVSLICSIYLISKKRQFINK